MKKIVLTSLALSLVGTAVHAAGLEAVKSQAGGFSISMPELSKGAKAMKAVAGSEAQDKTIKTLSAAPAAAPAANKPAQAPAQAGKEAEPLTCKNAPGTALCRQLQKIIRTYGYTCTGNACYGLFKTMTEELGAFSKEYESVAGWEQKAETDIGDLAFEAAVDICAVQVTGEASIIARLMLAANQALDNLLEIQKGAQREEPKHCRLVMN